MREYNRLALGVLGLVLVLTCLGAAVGKRSPDIWKGLFQPGASVAAPPTEAVARHPERAGEGDRAGDDHRNELDEALGELKRERGKAAVLSGEIDEAKVGLFRFSCAMAAALLELKRQGETTDALRKEVVKGKAEADKFRHEAWNLSGVLKREKASSGYLQQDVARARADNEKTRQERDALRAELARIKAEGDKLRRELEASRAEAKREKAAAEALRKKLVGLEKP